MKASDRQFGILVLGVALVSAAGWHLVVDPMRTDLRADRTALAATKAEIQQGVQSISEHDSDRVVEEIQSHADTFHALWEQADDVSGMFDQIQDLAAQSGVRVDHIEPRRSSVPGEVVKEFNKLGIAVSRQSYSIELSGDFNSVRSFVNRFQSDGSLARVDSIRLAAARNAESPETINGNLSVSYFAVAGAFGSDEGVQP